MFAKGQLPLLILCQLASGDILVEATPSDDRRSREKEIALMLFAITTCLH
jgi:hypothetical protein